ncbi:uncharacterized protein LOC122087482 [Macadamia integrifolia]|uniref:uncharacterized protein LOC122087482 n=1 Tax=Macadamia integrifolia TaxID=60698 RepID=UPI001C4F406E|nr:uncharacterized protein LOC122087482 [Macadamia integrifolia]
MGNCLALQEKVEKVIKVMKTDGKVLEYQEPLRVHQVLSEFAGHAISDTLPVLRHLHPNTQMISGRNYYLLPPPLPSSGSCELPVASNPITTEPTGHGNGVVRVKIVITKQKLEEMLRKEGLSVDEIISHLQNGQSKGKDVGNCDDESRSSSRVWKPVLESIPEGITDVNY